MISNIILFSFGGPELIVILVVVILLFGGKKIPELMRGMGKGLKEFKEGQKHDDNDKKPEEKDK